MTEYYYVCDLREGITSPSCINRFYTKMAAAKSILLFENKEAGLHKGIGEYIPWVLNYDGERQYYNHLAGYSLEKVYEKIFEDKTFNMQLISKEDLIKLLRDKSDVEYFDWIYILEDIKVGE